MIGCFRVGPVSAGSKYAVLRTVMNNKQRRAFTILELLISMFLVTLLMGPILNTFQVSERMSRRNYKSFSSQNLASEMMNEIAKKSFDDPYQASTINVNLKPGPTHEEYLADALAPKIANGTIEVSGVEEPRMLNETLINRAKYYNDIDDYDGYNTDETILPTLADGREYIDDGENPYANLRVKVEVKSSASGARPPEEVLKNGATLGGDPKGLAITADCKYAAVINAADKTLSIINLQTGYEVDCGPNGSGLDSLAGTPCTNGVDRIPLSTLSDLPAGGGAYNLGEPVQVITGPSGDRFFVTHKAAMLDADLYSGISVIDMNPHNTPEASFHKVFDTNLVSKHLRSNSINSIVCDRDGIVYAATNGGGLSKSEDNGETWKLQKLLLSDGATVAGTIYCLAATKRGYGRGDSKYIYAGGSGGFWISKDDGPWNRVSISGASNITAIAAMDNGYAIAGSDNVNVYLTREYDINFIQKTGPSIEKINTLAIDDNCRVWAGNNTGLFYSENIFHAATPLWNAHMPAGLTAAKINNIHIDRSRGYPAPFVKILGRDSNPATSNPACPSLYASESGLHLFYLDDSGEVGAGGAAAFNNPKLWHINSPDYGKSWNVPQKICDTPAGKAAWAHSEAIDKNGVIHAVWRDNRGVPAGHWRVYYQRSSDGGKSWLSSDICIGNEDDTYGLNGLNYQTGNLAEWIPLGSNYFRQITVSSTNRVFVVFSGGANHYIRYSNDGGRSWPPGNSVTIPFTSGVTNELVQSIDFIEPMNKLMLVFITGSDGLKRKMSYIQIYEDGANSTSTSALNITNANLSAPPAFNDEWKFFYLYQYLEDTFYNIGQSYSHYPFSQFPQDTIPSATAFSRNKIQRKQFWEYPLNVREIYTPVCVENSVYAFFASSAAGSVAEPRRLLMIKSETSGATYCDPIHIDKIHSAFDTAAAARFGETVYVVKKTDGASPNSDFHLGEFSANSGFACADNRILSFNAGLAPVKSFSNYDFAGEKIKCFTGDGSGNMLYGSSSGLFVRNINFANKLLQTPPGASASMINYPPEFEGGRWRRFFNGVSVSCVFAEKNGVWWAGTADKGIFRTNDYGETWQPIEAKLSIPHSLTGTANFIGKGSAANVNKITFESVRYNLMNPNDLNTVIMEGLFSVYNLSCNKIESATLVTQGQPGNFSSVSVNSYDNSKIITYNGLDKKISIKKPDREYKHALSAGSSQNSPSSFGESDHLYTGIFIDKNCTLEISAARKFSAFRNMRSFFTTPGDSAGAYGILNFKTGGAAGKCFQYFQGAAPDAGELIYFLAPVEIYNAWKDRTGYCLVRTVIKYFSDVIDASSTMTSGVTGAFAAPDNKTVFFVDHSGDKVYSISDINDTASIQFEQYSQNIINPVSVIFSPKNRNGEYKTYVVCENNIVDLFGSKLIGEVPGLSISGAAVSDNGDIFFVDKTSKKLYKRVSSAEKTVYVTVKEVDDGTAGSMPPVTLARKFHDWRAADEVRRGSIPNRNYIKYDYTYTSQKYPGGISASADVLWEPQKRGAADTLNAYVVDSFLSVNGTLEIAAGTVVKFSTANKLVNTTNWSGKSNSGILVRPGGKLIVSGGMKETEKVLFTSLDDNTIAPSAYSAGDLTYSLPGYLPNPQLVRLKTSDPLPYCGVKYGDWGKADGTPANAYGGLCFSISGGGIINNLEMKYAVLYTESLYPDGIVPPDFIKPRSLNEWGPTNVYIVNQSLKAGNQTRLHIKQGTIVKYETGASITFENDDADNTPWYSLIVDGSYAEPVYFSHASYADLSSRREGSTPNGGAGNIKTIIAAGMPDMASIKGAVFYGSDAEHFNLKGSEFKISNSTIGRENFTEKLSIVTSDYDGSQFYNNLFNLSRNCISLSYDAVNIFSRNYFKYNRPGVAMMSFLEDYLLSASHNSVLVLKDNHLSLGGSGDDKSSKIKVKAAAYITDNKFNSLNYSLSSSCEINISDTSDTPLIPAWPMIRNNLFNAARCAIYLKGGLYADTASLLDGRIINNSFTNFDTMNFAAILKTEIPYSGDFPASPANAAADADGNIYIPDSSSHLIYKYSANGSLISTFGGQGNSDGRFQTPAAVAINNTGEIYVADKGNRRIQKFDRDANFILKFGTPGTSGGEFNAPSAIAVLSTATSETLFVSDSSRNCVLKFSNTGKFSGELDKAALLTPSALSSPGGLIASSDGDFLYVTDTDNHRVLKLKLNLTTEEIELGDDYFAIEPRYFGVNNDLATWPLGFAPGGSVEEGGHIELVVTARKGDGTLNTSYGGTPAKGKIYIDHTTGIVTWEGAGITDLAADNSNNGANYGFTVPTFTSGEAKFYVRSTMAASSLKVTIVDDANASMKGSAEISWTVEDTPPALEFIGTNSKGFRKYICKNDPSVTFIKIPASAFDRGDGTYGGAPTEIKMSTYYIAETPTTNAQFNNWRNSPGAPMIIGGWASYSGLSSYSNHPAICLQKDDAKNYSYWLITGSNSGQNEMYHASADQHEKASRGAKLYGVGNNAAEKLWPWGNTWNTANCNENSIQTPDERIFIGLFGMPKGTTRVNRYPEMGYYGLRDITGNCWVWLRDNVNLITGGSWYYSGLGSESYRCSYTTIHNTTFFAGGGYDSVRPCFYWPVQ